ncbi:hypothetical protein PISMIDRAFT_153009 [Pisolithus microcarpus 441]|uniref:Uncharacterized protein n=1 Tax=Pisolithus microcarpus 441 TaxID=765257 RepID=A0A0C9Y429_9AGAM|nr:hypothetical protein PISMIDRAFT_153009 [Pisolithus microcarpus 441]
MTGARIFPNLSTPDAKVLHTSVLCTPGHGDYWDEPSHVYSGVHRLDNPLPSHPRIQHAIEWSPQVVAGFAMLGRIF